ncbi:excisionase family DNA-binding protein [Rhodococcus hoagii]|nr:excisionase family DNA-binding protein [Prescottella equi]
MQYTTIRETANRLGVSDMTIRRMVARGELTAYRIGPRMLRLDADEVDRLAIKVPVGTTAGHVAKARSILTTAEVER